MSKPYDDRRDRKTHREQGLLTLTMLARWAETSAYTPPEEPTTGAVMSATDTAKEPGTERVKTMRSAGLTVQPSPGRPSPSAMGAEQLCSHRLHLLPSRPHASSWLPLDCTEDLCVVGLTCVQRSYCLLMGNQDSKDKPAWLQLGLIPNQVTCFSNIWWCHQATPGNKRCPTRVGRVYGFLPSTHEAHFHSEGL